VNISNLFICRGHFDEISVIVEKFFHTAIKFVLNVVQTVRDIFIRIHVIFLLSIR